MTNLENENTQAQSSNKNMMMIGGIVVAVVVLGGAFLLMNSNKSTPQVSTNSTPRATTTTSASPLATTTTTNGTVKTFTMDGKNFRFTPAEIRVKKGDKVKVVLTVSDMQHDFVIDELNVRTKVGKTGETVDVEFTANQVGTFQFYCSVGNHKAQGMVGNLIVE